MDKYYKNRTVTETYFTTEPLELKTLIELLNNIPNDYRLILAKEVMHDSGNGINKSIITCYPIIEIAVNDNKKEVNFFISKSVKHDK